MKIFFSTLFDNESYPGNVFIKENIAIGDQHLGPIGLLNFFELHLGLGYYVQNENLRILQYCEQLRMRKRSSFYERSFAENELEVAKFLLRWRDELVAANWNFDVKKNTPKRLADLAKVEAGLKIEAGIADRYKKFLAALQQDNSIPLETILLHEPMDKLPPLFQRLFQLLQKKGIEIKHYQPTIKPVEQTDLGRLQQFILEQNRGKFKAKNDGSITLLRFPSLLAASHALAATMKANSLYRPVIINEISDPCLSLALKHGGLPASGQAHTCNVDPAVQFITLLPVWLWKPYDPHQVLDFLLSPVNVLPRGLRNIWAKEFCECPGFEGNVWKEKMDTYINACDVEAGKAYQRTVDYLLSVGEDGANAIDKEKLTNYFKTIHKLLKAKKDQPNIADTGYCLLQLIELLEISPKTAFNKLELQQLIIMVLKPYSAVIHEKEQHSYHEIAHPGLLVDACEDLLWFGFFNNQPPAGLKGSFSKEEITWLHKQDIQLDTPGITSERNYWHLSQWVQHVSKRLVLVIPATHEGEAAQPHPFYPLISSCFENAHILEKEIDAAEEFKINRLENAEVDEIDIDPIPQFPAHWNIKNAGLVARRKAESYNSLNQLIGYPYRWVLEYAAQLRSPEQLCLPSNFLFYGNLSHELFQQILTRDDLMSLSEKQLRELYTVTAEKTIQTSGILLELAGEERKLSQFREGLFDSFSTLLKLIKDNGWIVEGCEIKEEKTIAGENILGKCDVLLRKENNANERAIVDLKFSGTKKYRDLMDEQQDLQLAIYSKVFHKGDSFCPTAYYIIDSKLMFCSDRHAFKDAIQVPRNNDFPAAYRNMMQQVEGIIAERRKELSAGEIEVGECVSTDELPVYNSAFSSILPKPDKKQKPSSKYNNFSTFIDTE